MVDFLPSIDDINSLTVGERNAGILISLIQ